MKTPSQMSEESMQRMEARIPELAGSAVKRAYLQALTTSGKVIEARGGQLIETTADGKVRVIRSIAKPVAVTMGTKRVRARQAWQHPFHACACSRGPMALAGRPVGISKACSTAARAPQALRPGSSRRDADATN